MFYSDDNYLDSMIMMIIAGWNLYDRNELVDLIEEALRRETFHNCLRPSSLSNEFSFKSSPRGRGGRH